MPTPASSLTSYCDGPTFLLYYDARSLGDRLDDTGVRVPASQVPTHPVVAQVLLGASGLIESACLRGNRYSVADLQALTGSSQAYLERLVADLAFWMILQRRPYSREVVPVQCQQALKTLDDLASGFEVFSLQEQMSAGDSVEVWTPTGPAPPRYIPITQGADRLFGDLSSVPTNPFP